MDFVTWILVGLAAGGLVTAFAPYDGFGLLGDVLLGVAGAVVAGLIFRTQMPLTGLGGTVAVALVGALLILASVHVLKAVLRSEGQ